MNILTFDIEEWYLEKVIYGNRNEWYKKYDYLLKTLLSLLDENSIKATFFCLGEMAVLFPDIIKTISSHGQEIGCHSNSHTWINKMTPEEFNSDTSLAINRIQELVGLKVISYRAPAFSIEESNSWAFQILSELGIKNDSSIFPGQRDFGGFPSFPFNEPVKIKYNDSEINEFPISLEELPILNKKIAYSGGGYFRFLPFSLVSNLMLKSAYNMCYFHIADLIAEKANFMSRKDYENYFKEPGNIKNRLSRYLKANIGHKSTFANFKKLIRTTKFVSIEEYLRQQPIQKCLNL